MLPKASRLNLKSDFDNVKQKGKFVKTELFTVSYVENKSQVSRFGFIVSKKVSMKATERNKIKRTLREIVRLNMNVVKTPTDFVIVAKSSANHSTHAKLESELLGILKNV